MCAQPDICFDGIGHLIDGVKLPYYINAVRSVLEQF